jgi:hypothetical protein
MKMRRLQRKKGPKRSPRKMPLEVHKLHSFGSYISLEAAMLRVARRKERECGAATIQYGHRKNLLYLVLWMSFLTHINFITCTYCFRDS